MPIYNRRGLRQNLGRDYLRDTLVGRTSGSWGTQAGSLNIIDRSLADPTASGEQLYYRHHLRLLGSAGVLQDLRVGTFNTGSGAFLAAVTAATTIFSGMPFEVHGMVSPDEKDRQLDAVIKDVRALQELTIPAVDDLLIYSLGPDVEHVLEARVQSDPSHSLGRDDATLGWWKVVTTATGRELRLSSPLSASQHLVLNAITAVSLGAGDLATVNLPSQEWALTGAAARCYWLLEAQAPGKEASRYKDKRQEMARHYSRLSQRFQPFVTRKVQLEEPW